MGRSYVLPHVHGHFNTAVEALNKENPAAYAAGFHSTNPVKD